MSLDTSIAISKVFYNDVQVPIKDVELEADNELLKTSLQETQSQLSAVTTERDNLQTELDTVNITLETLRTQLSQSAHANNELQAQVNTLTAEKTELQNQITALNTQITNLQVQLVEARAALNTKQSPANDFTFSGNTITAYNGTDTNIVLPTSYSTDSDGNIIDGDDTQVTTIGTEMLYNNSTISSVVIPEGYTTINNNAFMNCLVMGTCVIPSTITTIGEQAFFGCQSLTGITLPEGLTTIPSKCFGSNYGITEITIPSTVSEIGSGAFYLCNNLTTITCLAEVPPTLAETTMFSSATNLTAIYIPAGTIDAYKTAWTEYADKFVEIKNVESLQAELSALEEEYEVMEDSYNSQINNLIDQVNEANSEITHLQGQIEWKDSIIEELSASTSDSEFKCAFVTDTPTIIRINDATNQLSYDISTDETNKVSLASVIAIDTIDGLYSSYDVIESGVFEISDKYNTIAISTESKQLTYNCHTSISTITFVNESNEELNTAYLDKYSYFDAYVVSYTKEYDSEALCYKLTATIQLSNGELRDDPIDNGGGGVDLPDEEF